MKLAILAALTTAPFLAFLSGNSAPVQPVSVPVATPMVAAPKVPAVR
jgi:hypothetical protein